MSEEKKNRESVCVSLYLCARLRGLDGKRERARDMEDRERDRVRERERKETRFGKVGDIEV